MGGIGRDVMGDDHLGSLPVEKVRIDVLDRSHSPRLNGISRRHVSSLANVDGPLPPILVHRSSMMVIDGMHRLQVARVRGDQEIDVRFVDGDDASAFVMAVRANILHGLPLSTADKKSAAARIIALYPQWSDRMIASSCGLSARAVAGLRARPTTDCPQLDKRVGRDGRSRPVDGAARREFVIELLSKDSRSSLREIARAAGVSPETVRRIRAKLPRYSAVPDSGAASVRNAREVDRGRTTRASTGHRTPDDAGVDGAAALKRLSHDPRVRSSSMGREMLRAMVLPAALTHDLPGLVAGLPRYSLPWTVAAARKSARAWQEFAELVQYDYEHRTAPDGR